MSYFKKYLLLSEPGKKIVLPGNYAIARGALEANVDVVTGYPGTPSSEVLEILNELSEEIGIYAEVSTNEIVAAEIAGGAAMAGLKALATMKHVGANVASDFLNTVNLTGIDGSFVVYIADDPGAWVSQNEQDTRVYCELFHIPCLEPYSQETAKLLTVKAFELSDKYKVPVILRTTHRIAHASGIVTLGSLPRYPKDLPSGKFTKNIERWYLGDIFVQKLHKELHEKLDKIKEEFTKFESNFIEKGSSEFGVIGDGVSIMYAKEAISAMGLDDKVSLLAISTIYPVPDKLIANFLQGLREVLVVEEVEPYIENYVKVIGMDYGFRDLKVYGRGSHHIPMQSELSPGIVANAIAKIKGISAPAHLGKDQWMAAIKKAEEKTPPRYLTFCPGCPHQATFYALKVALA
ncbi:MAG: indolepyruvate ferredoxin oxidoreductase subunit alpha, partial [Desulfurococcaceae archaeon]